MSSQDLLQHIFLPLPSLKNMPKPPASKEDQLKEIISNLEKQQQQVRNNIIAAAQIRLESQNSAHIPDDESSSMDLSTPSEGEINSQQDSTAIDTLIANLSTPFEGSGDLVSTRRQSTAAEVRQATPPPQIRIAKETLDQIALYDQHASKAKEYYVKALERRKSSTTGSGITPALNSSGFNTYPISGAGNTSANASPMDAYRDPRRRER